MSAHVWRPLKVEGRWNPVLRRQATNASGAYAVRDAKTHQVLYVGESSTGALWKTFQRHFQDWSSLPEHYYDRRGRKRQRGEEFTNKHPERLEGCFEVTSHGKRTKERADEKAMAAQARWIASMHPSWNRDDGLADGGATAREVRAAQDAQEPEDAWGGLLNPRHSSFVQEAATLPADLELVELESGWAITSSTWSADDFLRLHPMMFGTRGEARGFGEWLVDALRTVRVDAKAHKKASELLAAPPKPPHWRDVVFEALPLGSSGKMWQVIARGFDREADARDVSMVLWTERPKLAELVVAVAELGELRAAEFRANVATAEAEREAQRARSERKSLGLPAKDEAPAPAKKPRKPRAKKAKTEVAPKPAGYGAVEESGRHKGQARLFNPRDRFRVPVPAGRLVELGRMTELEVEQAPDRKIHAMRWDYARAPILAYDQRGRLFVVYGAHATGKASAEEDAEYKRSHWGKSPHGRVYSATIAERPLVLVGTSTRITYTTKKGRDVELTDYVHAWGEGAAFGTKVEPPRVFEHRCKSGAGCKENRALCIVGGSYRVTPDGIVG